MLQALSLDAEALDRLYPCHLVLDVDACIVGAGRVLRRLLPDLAAAPRLDEAFTLERPHGPADFASLCRARDSTFLLTARSRPEIRLKGELFPVPSQQCAVLFTVLWFTDGSALDALDLTVNDFALSDASCDLIFLIETQAALLRDARILTERLRVARDEAVSASRLKSEFLANMSHELRTPLNAIIGFSDYLLAVGAGTLPDKYVEYISDIRASGSFLLEIINDLLDLSRIEAGKLMLEEETVDLGAVAREAIKSVGERAREKSLRIELTGFDSPVEVRADQRLLRQVLLNLTSNAVKFNREGGSVQISAERAEDGSLSIAVLDTGIGVDPAVIPELFEPFRQANSKIARQYGGTGLGLAIVRQLIRLHGGDVVMQSRRGIGTTVSFTMPSSRVGAACGMLPAKTI